MLIWLPRIALAIVFVVAGAVAFWVLNGNLDAATVPGVLLLLIAGFGWREV